MHVLQGFAAYIVVDTPEKKIQADLFAICE